MQTCNKSVVREEISLRDIDIDRRIIIKKCGVKIIIHKDI